MFRGLLYRASSFLWQNRKRGNILQARLPIVILSLLVALVLTASAKAEKAKVTVELGKTVNILTNTSIALPASMFDGDAFHLASARFTGLAGATTLRYPGGSGIADLYHWTSNTLTKVPGKDSPYIAGGSDFGNFAKNLDRYGTALIVVNYGTNLKGSGGADYGEATAWVAYANGDAGAPRPIPKGNAEEDWHTVGFWATIRSQTPLASDDGLNFLRIAHPKPFGIRLWQIGDQIYNNGYYGGTRTGTIDLHAPLGGQGAKARTKNNDLGPSFYGSQVAAFSKAMKAVDPSIRIGAALAFPDGQPTDLDWNDKVLMSGCSDIDFVSLDWEPNSLSPPDWKTIDEADMLSTSRDKIGALLKSVLNLYRQDCPRDHMPRIAFSTAAIPTWPRLDHPIFTSLWVADTYAILIETGAENVAWSEMHGSSMISSDGKKFGPAYMGLEMLHIIASKPGDALVSAASDHPLLAVHATRRRDGVVGLMLVNDDPNSAIEVTVTLSGATVGPKGRRLDYGAEQQKSGSPVTQSEISGLGGSFTVTVPAYTITDILIPPAQ